MDINPSVPLILIPWDQLFKNFSGKEHVVTLTKSMGGTLDTFRKNPSQGMINNSNRIEVRYFSDKHISSKNFELEEMYENSKESLSRRFNTLGVQTWMFANRFLLKEFELFFSPEEAQYLEPRYIIKPHTMFVSDKDGSLVFSYVKDPREIICFQ